MPAEENASAHSSSISTAVGPRGGTASSPITSMSSKALSALARPQLRRQPLRVLAVGGDDSSHQLVANHVLLAKANELDALDVLQHVRHDDQTRVLLPRQVDLRDVAGHDG